MFEVPEAVFGPPPRSCDGQMLVFKVTDQIIDNLPHTDDHGLQIDHHAHHNKIRKDFVGITK